MRKWDVYFTAVKISKGLELDFFENPVTNDDDGKLAKNDVLNVEITSRRQKHEGMVSAVLPDGSAIIMVQNTRWKISPATADEKVHPVVQKAKPHIWFVREEVG